MAIIRHPARNDGQINAPRILASRPIVHESSLRVKILSCTLILFTGFDVAVNRRSVRLRKVSFRNNGRSGSHYTFTNSTFLEIPISTRNRPWHNLSSTRMTNKCSRSGAKNKTRQRCCDLSSCTHIHHESRYLGAIEKGGPTMETLGLHNAARESLFIIQPHSLLPSLQHREHSNLEPNALPGIRSRTDRSSVVSS